jgi:hypothetical protein
MTFSSERPRSVSRSRTSLRSLDAVTSIVPELHAS